MHKSIRLLLTDSFSPQNIKLNLLKNNFSSSSIYGCQLAHCSGVWDSNENIFPFMPIFHRCVLSYYYIFVDVYKKEYQTNRRFTALPQQVLRSPLSHQLNFLANNTTQIGDYQKYHSNQIFPITPLILIFTKYFLTNLPKLHKLHLTRNNKDNPKNHEVHMSGFWAYPSDWQ